MLDHRARRVSGDANLRELMERMGHSSTRAALVYLHASRSGDRGIADGIGRQMAAGGAGEDQGDDDATGVPDRGDLARNLARGPIRAQSPRPVDRSASALTSYGAGDGNRTRIVSLGTAPGAGPMRSAQVVWVRFRDLSYVVWPGGVARAWPVAVPSEAQMHRHAAMPTQ